MVDYMNALSSWQGAYYRERESTEAEEAPGHAFNTESQSVDADTNPSPEIFRIYTRFLLCE